MDDDAQEQIRVAYFDFIDQIDDFKDRIKRGRKAAGLCPVCARKMTDESNARICKKCVHRGRTADDFVF